MKRILPILIICIQFSLQAQTTDKCVSVPGAAFNSCQLFNQNQDPRTGQPLLINTAIKNSIPQAAQIGANVKVVSFTRTNTHPNHPSGGALFPTESQLASSLDNFLKSIEEDTYFIVYFTRMHLIILHELYQYLMSIYTCFNMTHVKTLDEYLVNESTQALNKKTMIINHLFNVIEAQLNQAVTAYFPAIPKHIATRTGPLLMQQDYGANLNQLIEGYEIKLFNNPEVQALLREQRTRYTNMFGNYLRFFKQYTATLEQKDPLSGSAFVRHAQDIQKKLRTEQERLQQQTQTTGIQQKIKVLREIKTLNPPLFFYEGETLRGLKIIPRIAQDLPKQSANVPWPEALVQAAQTKAVLRDAAGTPISTEPAAYFRDAQGNRTTNRAQAVQLFVNIPTLKHMYTQEVLKQPNWLNSYQGVMLMLRACLGDFTAIFEPLLQDEKILDPCISCIILNAANSVGIAVPNAQQICTTCNKYIEELLKIAGHEGPLEPKEPDLTQPEGAPDQLDISGAPGQAALGSLQ